MEKWTTLLVDEMEEEFPTSEFSKRGIHEGAADDRVSSGLGSPDSVVDLVPADLVARHPGWIFVAIRKSEGVYDVFVDGRLARSEKTSVPRVSTDAAMNFGWSEYWKSERSAGGLDEVRLYSRALSDEEIARLHAVTSVEVNVEAKANAYAGGRSKPLGFTLEACDLLTIMTDRGNMDAGRRPTALTRVERRRDGSRSGDYGAGGLSAPYGSLVGRIGDGPLFLVGDAWQGKVEEGGELLLFAWDDFAGDNSGSITARVSVTRGQN